MKFPPVPPHIMSKPQTCSLSGFGSTAPESGGENSAQGAELFQNQWVSHIPPHGRPSLLMFHSLTAASLHRTMSIQNLSQMEKPWENVTLNRCLFVAITILVLTSGFQRLHGNNNCPTVVQFILGRHPCWAFWQRQCGVRRRWRKRRMRDWESDAQ